MKHKDDLIKYFKVFSDKNIDELSKMFSNDIELKDWNIFASGKKNVVAANCDIFNSVNTIHVTPIKFYSNSETSYAVQIFILVNGEEKLDVIDVIKFNSNGLINSIVAFKLEG
jgi:hypothetical protein